MISWKKLLIIMPSWILFGYLLHMFLNPPSVGGYCSADLIPKERYDFCMNGAERINEQLTECDQKLSNCESSVESMHDRLEDAYEKGYREK